MRKQLIDTMSKTLEKNKETILLLGDIGVHGFRHAKKQFPNRVYNIGILEQTTVSLAAGLKIAGFIPTVHTIAPFLIERAYEQIKVDFCYQGLGGNLVTVGGSYDYAALGCTHHCPSDVMMINLLPNSEIFLPGHSNEFNNLFQTTYKNDHLSYFRLGEEENETHHEVKPYKNSIVKDINANTTIVCVGSTLKNVLLATKNLDVNIIYCTTVKPFDVNSLRKFLDGTLILIEPYASSVILDQIIVSHKMPNEIVSHNIPKKFIEKYGSRAEIDKLLGFDTKSIKNLILKHKNN